MTPRAFAAVLVAALPLLLTACDFEQVIDLDVPPYESRLVLGGFPTPDNVFSVNVGRSVSALSTSGTSDPFGLLVTDARVVLFDEDGAFLDSLAPCLTCDEAPGTYHSSRGLRPEPGRAYTVRVEAPGFPTAEATTRMPDPVPVDARIVRINEPTEYGDRSVRLAVTVPDPPRAQTYALTVALLPGDDLYEQPLTFRSSATSLRESFDRLDVAVDIDLDVDPEGRYFFGRALFRDGLFAGTSHEIELDAFYYETGGNAPTTIPVTLSTLSEDYVRYQQTLALQDVTGDNPFAEPVRIHSNVEGGLGAFAGYTSSTVTLEVE